MNTVRPKLLWWVCFLDVLFALCIGIFWHWGTYPSFHHQLEVARKAELVLPRVNKNKHYITIRNWFYPKKCPHFCTMQERQRRLTLSMKYQSKIDFGRGINQLSPTPFLVTTIAAVLTNETGQNRPLWAKKAKGVRRSHSVRGYVKIKYRFRGFGMFLCSFSDLFLLQCFFKLRTFAWVL